VSGGSSNGAGAVGVSQSFHTWRLAGEPGSGRGAGTQVPLESTENKKMFVSTESVTNIVVPADLPAGMGVLGGKR
jgi:hypothetical protein